MYNLDDKLSFGKYEGFSVRDIYCGQKYISQKFLNDFLDFKLNGLEFKLSASSKDWTIKANVQIKDFEILINNQLAFDLVFTNNKSINSPNINSIYSSAFDWINWDLILDDRYEAKDVFEKPNDIIIEINKVNSTFHALSSDADYINWCLKNLDTFFLNPEDLIRLQYEKCFHFYGISLFSAGFPSRIYKYEPIIVSNTFRFDDDAINLNREKFEKKTKKGGHTGNHIEENGNINSSHNYEHLNDLQYPDGYGGYHDNDVINDVFEGDSDNYWNID